MNENYDGRALVDQIYRLRAQLSEAQLANRALQASVAEVRAKLIALEGQRDTWGNEFNAVVIMKECLAETQAKLDCATETLRLISAFQHRVVISNADTLRQSELADAALTKIGKEDAMVGWTYRDKAIVPGVGHD
jgi:hypothetical protein